MIKALVKKIIKYPIMAVNRMYLYLYFSFKKKGLNANELNTENNKKVIVFAPHVDDETIGLGGTLVKFKNNKNPMTIVYLTDGSGSTSDKSKEEIIKERKEEGYRVKESYGFEKIIFLDILDGKLDSKDVNLKEKIYNILLDENPDMIFTPFVIDGNTDHIETTKALSHSIEKWNNEFRYIFLYQVNNLISPKIINTISLLDKNIYEEKIQKFEIFKSQWAMGFTIFNAIDKKSRFLYKNTYALESFVNISIDKLKKVIESLEKQGFKPDEFKQISSEYTFIYATRKSLKNKRIYNEIIYNEIIIDVLNNQKMGGGSEGAF